jgi:hypothetical protein
MEHRDRCEAFMEAAIIFCRAAIHRVKTEYEGQPGWKNWWNRRRDDPDLAFIRKRHDWIVQEAPESFGQVIRPGQPMQFAADCYYYERANVRATVDDVFATIKRERAEALNVLPGAAGVHAARVADLAVKSRIAVVGTERRNAETPAT